MRLARLSLAGAALVFIGFGLWGWAMPADMLARFGVNDLPADGRTAIRAMYGGFLVAGGLLFGWSALNSSRTRFGLVALMLISGLVLAARLTGLALDGARDPLHVLYAGFEAVGVIVAAIGLSSTRRRP